MGAHLVVALSYKPKDCGFDYRRSFLDFSLTESFRSNCDPEVDSASDRNGYQGSSLGAKAAGV
jgi:hypothetical protein